MNKAGLIYRIPTFLLFFSRAGREWCSLPASEAHAARLLVRADHTERRPPVVARKGVEQLHVVQLENDGESNGDLNHRQRVSTALVRPPAEGRVREPLAHRSQSPRLDLLLTRHVALGAECFGGAPVALVVVLDAPRDAYEGALRQLPLTPRLRLQHQVLLDHPPRDAVGLETQDLVQARGEEGQLLDIVVAILVRLVSEAPVYFVVRHAAVLRVREDVSKGPHRRRPRVAQAAPPCRHRQTRCGVHAASVGLTNLRVVELQHRADGAARGSVQGGVEVLPRHLHPILHLRHYVALEGLTKERVDSVPRVVQPGFNLLIRVVAEKSLSHRPKERLSQVTKVHGLALADLLSHVRLQLLGNFVRKLCLVPDEETAQLLHHARLVLLQHLPRDTEDVLVDTHVGGHRVAEAGLVAECGLHHLGIIDDNVLVVLRTLQHEEVRVLFLHTRQKSDGVAREVGRGAHGDWHLRVAGGRPDSRPKGGRVRVRGEDLRAVEGARHADWPVGASGFGSRRGNTIKYRN
eukprot:Hpha_TRINITY_DN15613_c1_g2::TRINITY_DN15613_c1_g2_i1::g.100110::m.100110